MTQQPISDDTPLCPDEAACHHGCRNPKTMIRDGRCWRIRTCGPASPHEDWNTVLEAVNGKLIEARALLVQKDAEIAALKATVTAFETDLSEMEIEP